MPQYAAKHTNYKPPQEIHDTVKDIFRGTAATVYRLRKRSQPCDSQAPASKRLCVTCIVPTTPKPEM